MHVFRALPALLLLSAATLAAPACSDRISMLGSADGDPTSGGLGGDNGGEGVLDTQRIGGIGGDTSVVGAVCATSSHAATLKPLDLYILLDQSGSMKETDDRWTPVSQAIQSFLESDKAQGLNVAIQYFALGTTDEVKCDVATYANPEVAPQPLPEGADTLIASLDAHDFLQSECCTNDNEHNGTPTRPAVEGALSYLEDYLGARPDHVAALLLATDGAPTSNCESNAIDDVAEVIETSATAERAIPTYVIGIGEVDSLSTLAEAGNTGSGPFIVDGSGTETEEEFAAALETIRGRAIPCDYDFPSGAATDPGRVNLSYRPVADSEPATALFVEDADECDPAIDAWYYDMSSGERRIHLCPRMCQTVSESNGGAIEIIVGCATRVR